MCSPQAPCAMRRSRAACVVQGHRVRPAPRSPAPTVAPPGRSAMRMRQVVVVFVVALASTLQLTGVASACKGCDPFLHCVSTSLGAQACIEGPGSCALFFHCVGGGYRIPDGGAEFLTTWSLFEAPVLPGPPRSLRREAGDIALGDEARAVAGGDAPAGALADAALAFGDAFALSLVDAAGDGFALQRSEEGGRVRLEVREVTHDVVGRLIANDVLGPRDQMRVAVRVEGRDRVLMLQAGDVKGGAGALEVARLRRSLAAVSQVLPRRSEPLLRAHGR